MANTPQVIKPRIKVKRDTSTNWNKATNFIPLEGEPIFYTDLNKIKIGDGITTVINLPFLTDEFNGVICNTSADVADKVGISNHFSEDGAPFSHFILTLTKGSTAEGNLTLNINGTGPKPIFDYATDEQIVEGEFPVGDYLVYYDYDMDGYYLDYNSIVGYSFCARRGKIGRTGARTIYGPGFIETYRFVRGSREVNTSNFDLSSAHIDFPENDGSISGLAAPNENNDATNKQYVDLSIMSAMSNAVSKSGDTMSGELNMGYHDISGITSLNGGLGWSINGDYTDIKGINTLKFKTGGTNPVIDIEASEKTQYPNERIEIHNVADPIDDYDVVNKHTYETLAGSDVAPARNISENFRDSIHMTNTSGDSGYSNSLWTDPRDGEKYVTIPNNTAWSLSDLQLLVASFGDGDSQIDPNKTYQIYLTTDFGTDFTIKDGDCVISCGDPNGVCEKINENTVRYIGKIPQIGIQPEIDIANCGFMYGGESGYYTICSAQISIRVQDDNASNGYVNGLMRGEDKAKYDGSEAQISSAASAAFSAQTTADSALTKANAALPKTGGTISGTLTLSGALTTNNTVTLKRAVTFSPTSTSYKFNMNNHKIEGLATPTVDSDAATKAYVDSAISAISHETWTFTLEDDTVVTKEVALWTSQQ